MKRKLVMLLLSLSFIMVGCGEKEVQVTEPVVLLKPTVTEPVVLLKPTIIEKVEEEVITEKITVVEEVMEEQHTEDTVIESTLTDTVDEEVIEEDNSVSLLEEETYSNSPVFILEDNTKPSDIQVTDEASLFEYMEEMAEEETVTWGEIQEFSGMVSDIMGNR